MPVWETEYNGQKRDITADTPEQAAVMARFYMAGPGPESAQTLNEGGRTTSFPRLGQPDVALNPATPEGLINLGLGAAAGGVAAPGATLGMAKDAAIYGTAKAGADAFGLPSWTADAVGLMSPANQLKNMFRGWLTRGAEKAVVRGAEGVVAGQAEKAVAARAADEARKAELHALRIEREKMRNEILKAKMEQTAAKAGEAPILPKSAVRAVPEPKPEGAGKILEGRFVKAVPDEPPILPDEAVSAVPEKATLLPKGRRSMATTGGGKAKPGPPPTPPDQLEETLRQSLNALSIAKPSGLQVPRIQIGAQNVGRQVGMTKEAVRQAAGPVLDEALGEASPILPKQALQSIINTMRSIPMAEREAYVARATSGKTLWQVENIRRTLEHLGLLIPAGVAAGEMSQSQ